MNKLDCTNIFVFLEEWERMRDAEENIMSAGETIDSITFETNSDIKYNYEAMVKEVQEWSDNHPRLTRRDKFIQLCKESGFEKVTEHRYDCDGVCCVTGNCTNCKKYWSEFV